MDWILIVAVVLVVLGVSSWLCRKLLKEDGIRSGDISLTGFRL